MIVPVTGEERAQAGRRLISKGVKISQNIKMKIAVISVAAVLIVVASPGDTLAVKIGGGAQGIKAPQTIPGGGNSTCDVDQNGEKPMCPRHGGECTCPLDSRGANCPFASKPCHLQSRSSPLPDVPDNFTTSHNHLLKPEVVTPALFENLIYIEISVNKEASYTQKPNPPPPRS